MPVLCLNVVTRACALTSTDLWTRRGPALYRRVLSTGENKFVIVFDTDILDIRACDGRCIVVSGDDGSATIWLDGLTLIAENVKYWAVPSQRVVYQDNDDRIWSWCAQGDARLVGAGVLRGASNMTILYEDHAGLKWPNGSPAKPGTVLWPDGVVTDDGRAREEPIQESGTYKIVERDGCAWLEWT